ncbi:MAG TPA: zf-HC2 domain-containing protein [Acidimicrobiia bacterium]|jgi:mycothiol system anti-sigma-R factor|nr:zf-HC2 domain-containing protein [Acidimicrobiia bacterium]
MSHEYGCGDAQDQLYQYIDSELDEETATNVRRHLDDCDGCHGSFEFYRRLNMVVRNHLAEDLPDSLEDKVKDLIRRESAAPFS